MRNIPFFISQGAKNLFRNGFMTAASTFILVVCMLVIGSFWLIYQNIENILSNTDDFYIITANIDDIVPGTTEDDEDIKAIKEKIIALDNVKNCRYISAEEAFESLKENVPEFSQLLDNKYNPMGRSFEITFSDPDKLDKLLYEVKNIEGIEKTREKLDLYKSASNLKKTLSIICIWIFGALFLVSILVIMTTVRITIFARREEIYIMRYLGATGRFVSAPFLVEGVIIGIVSAVITLGIQYYLYNFLVIDSFKKYFTQNLISFSDNALVLSLGFLCIGLFAGLFATALSIKKYLKA